MWTFYNIRWTCWIFLFYYSYFKINHPIFAFEDTDCHSLPSSRIWYWSEIYALYSISDVSSLVLEAFWQNEYTLSIGNGYKENKVKWPQFIAVVQQIKIWQLYLKLEDKPSWYNFLRKILRINLQCSGHTLFKVWNRCELRKFD